MEKWIFLFFSAAFLENTVLTRFYGSTHALAAARSFRSALRVGLPVCAVMTISGPLSYLLERFLLTPFSLSSARLLVFALIPAFFATLIEIGMKKYDPDGAASLGLYLPLIASCCAVLTLCLNLSEETRAVGASVMGALVYSLGAGVGFLLACLILALVQDRIEEAFVPSAFRGVPLALIGAGLCALCFSGFAVLG